MRDLISDALPRLSDSYRAEFEPLLALPDDDALKAAFARALKSNLRAIPLFGSAFCAGVIEQTPDDRAIGLGEETSSLRRFRPAAFAALAAALIMGGAIADHVWSDAQSAAQTPVVFATPAPSRAPHAAPTSVPVAVVSPRPERSTPAPAETPAQPAPIPAPAAAAPQPAARPAIRATAPPGRGVRTVLAVPRTPQPTRPPTLAPQDVDVSDMPRAYSDATPLPPSSTPPPAQIAAPKRLATPTPAPRHPSWLDRTLMHMDPFKPSPRSSP